MKKLLKILGMLLIIVVVLAAGGFIYLQVAFPKMSPAQNLKIEQTQARIERGRYLASGIASCIDCHSTRDFSKFSGPVVTGTEGKGGMDFGEGAGFVPAKNITSDKETGIGGWTDGEILRSIIAGISKDGKFLAPMMPYQLFSLFDKEDLYAIIAYIRTLPPIKNSVPEKKLKFPVNLIFRTLPEEPKEFGKLPSPTDKVKLGEYYGVPCKFCHSQSDKGKVFTDKVFSGGVPFPMPDGNIIRSANITPDIETGIGKLTKEMFISKFRMNTDLTNLDLQKRGYNTVMPWNQLAITLTDEDLGAIYEYLMMQKPITNKVEKISLQGVQ